MKDLALLVADKNMEFALRAALARPKSLGIRPLSVTFIKHPERDGGVRSNGASLLSVMSTSHAHAMSVLDFEGAGATGMTPASLEDMLDEELRFLWETRAKSIVIAPELDVWMWGNDDLLRDILGWDEPMALREWLTARGYTFGVSAKPDRPKEALEAVMHSVRRPRSSALYREIASRISLARCTDPAFVRLRDQLRRWFPATGR